MQMHFIEALRFVPLDFALPAATFFWRSFEGPGPLPGGASARRTIEPGAEKLRTEWNRPASLEDLETKRQSDMDAKYTV